MADGDRADNLSQIRYTAAIAKVRGTYPYISDIADDVPVKSEVDYWKNVYISSNNAHPSSDSPFHGATGSRRTRRNSRVRPRSAPSNIKGMISPCDSQHHDRCTQGKKAPPPLAPAKPLTQAELKAADIVSQDKIWRQSVNNEQTGLKRWENAWGFLTEFDPKGQPIVKEPLPEKVDQLSKSHTPVTNAGNYGSRVHTELGQRMMGLEFQLGCTNRKKKLGAEMICY